MQEVCLPKTREEFFYLQELCNANQDKELLNQICLEGRSQNWLVEIQKTQGKNKTKTKNN